MAKRAYLVVELVLLVAALLLGHFINDHWSVIPKAIVNMPSPRVYIDDFLQIGAVILVVHMLVFVVLSILRGPGVFQNARRTAIEIYGLIFSVTLASLILFLFFQIAYSPNLLLAIALAAFGLFIAAHVVGQTIAPAPAHAAAPLNALGRILGEGFRLVIRPLGIATLLFAVAPILLAKAFVSDRDLANRITQLRMYFATADKADWALVNAFPGTRFLRPIQIRFPPKRADELHILHRDGVLLSLPYTLGRGVPPESQKIMLDLKNRLGPVEIENGALGFDYHPEFGNSGSPNQGYVYVYYTEFSETRQINHLSRFDLSLPTLEERMASELSLMALGRTPSGFHNGGTVEFGPDGFLYLAIGEATETESHQRIDRDLFGGILRIDVDQRGGTISHPIRRQPANGRTANYAIPSDNPFSGRPDSLEEFWALGLRNPFRVSFDPETGTLWAGEVGSDAWEEVNVIRKGGNYQFPYIEGREPQNYAKPAQPIGQEIGPVYTYRHTAFDRAVIGGLVYRGTRHPSLQGKYIFAENYSGKILAIDATDKETDRATLLAKSDEFVAQRGMTSLLQAPDGAILITALGRGGEASGEILRMLPAAEAASLPKQPASPAPVAALAAEPRVIFGTDCSRCHGTTGKGDGPDAKAMVEAYNLKAMPDLTAPALQMRLTDVQLERVIRKGGPAIGLSEGMPPWEDVYNDAEIKALVQYVRSLKR